MPYTLQEIADKVQIRLKQAANPSASFDILTLLQELVFALQFNAGPDERDATIAKLQAEVASLNSSNMQQADILQKLKTILKVPDDRTMTYLPMRAQEVMDLAYKNI